MSLYPSSGLLPGNSVYPDGVSINEGVFQIAENVVPVLDLTIEKEWTIDAKTSVALSFVHILNEYPIMGYVFNPTDVEGSVVRVESDLDNYYYILDTTANQLYWGSQSRSQNTTNDY